jgi:hypothetical protein
MSFITTVYVPGAIVLASDSRQSIIINAKDEKGKKLPSVQTTSSDSVDKTFLLEEQGVGLSFAGEAMLGRLSTESHIKKFIEEEIVKKDTVITIADKVLKYFKKNFPTAKTTIHVAGFKKEEGKSIPYVYVIQVASNKKERKNVNDKKDIQYGATWGGEGDIIARLLLAPLPRQDGKGMFPKLPILYKIMTAQDAVDFSTYLIRTTIETMRFQARPKSVGGPIDVLLITPEESKWIQKKRISGEKD